MGFHTVNEAIISIPGGGVLQISRDGDDRMGAKIKTQKKSLGLPTNPKKSLDQKLTPKDPLPNFRALKISNKD